MRRTIGADQAGAVYGEHDRQILDLDVVYQLIVGALQESGINGHHRLATFASQPGGKRQCMLLGDADIEITLRILLREFHHSRALAHRRRDGNQTFIQRRHVAQPVAEDLGVGRLAAGLAADDATGGSNLRDPVIEHRIDLGKLVALALARHHMQELRPLQLLDVVQRRQQRIEIMAVDGADVVEAEFLEHRARRHHALDVFFARGRARSPSTFSPRPLAAA